MDARHFRVARTSVMVLALIAALRASADTPITTCGQSVWGTGVLADDLDCSRTLGPAVRLANGATLRLVGHTITDVQDGVHCESSCRLLGPGAIRRPSYEISSASGVFVDADVVVRGVTFENWSYAVWALENAKVLDSTFTDGAFGVAATNSFIKRSRFTGHTTMAVGPVWTIEGDDRMVGGVHVVRDSVFLNNEIDISTAGVRPRVRNTACSTSFDMANWTETIGDQWDVCP